VTLHKSFSGKIYIYHENELPLSQLAALTENLKSAGRSLNFVVAATRLPLGVQFGQATSNQFRNMRLETTSPNLFKDRRSLRAVYISSNASRVDVRQIGAGLGELLLVVRNCLRDFVSLVAQRRDGAYLGHAMMRL
jgi:hypothetical protein